MDGNFRQNVPVQAPDLAEMAGCRSEPAPNCSDASSLTADHSKRGFLHIEDAGPCWTPEWTNEKHNSYLNYLEASFVNQLHHSMGLIGLRSQRNTWEPSLSQQLPSNTCNTSDQFTILRDDCWQKINFEMNHSKSDSTADSPAILGSSWKYHVSPVGKCHSVACSDMLEHKALRSEVTHRKGKGTLPCKTATRSEQVPVGSIVEVSDQNFMDERLEVKLKNVPVSKRSKTAVADDSSQEQVVPFGKLYAKEISTACNAFSGREEWEHCSRSIENPENSMCLESAVDFFSVLSNPVLKLLIAGKRSFQNHLWSLLHFNNCRMSFAKVQGCHCLPNSGTGSVSHEMSCTIQWKGKPSAIRDFRHGTCASVGPGRRCHGARTFIVGLLQQLPPDLLWLRLT